MHNGTILWNGSDLALVGKPKLTIKRQADPPAPSYATRVLVTLTVSVDLEAMDSGTVQARAEFLAASMAVAEGILEIQSGGGQTLSWLASPGDSNLAEVSGGRSNTVELNFSAVETHSNLAVAALTAAGFTPTGSTVPLVLHAIRDVKEEVRTARHSERNAARSATTTTLAFTARYAMANPAEPLAARLAYLQAQALAVKQLDTSEGVLVLGSINRIVRVTDFSPVMDERRGLLDVTVQCYSITLPDSGTAECAYDIETRIDAGSGEEVLSLKGSIEAESRSIALAKLEVIRTAQVVSGQRVAAYSTSDKVIDGFDNAGIVDGDWTGGITFTLEVRKARPGGFHTLKITTSRDARSGMKWNYSGSVLAIDEATALATARAIAAGTGHPLQTRSEESVERSSEIDMAATLRFVKLDFTYEFEGPSDGFIAGEITTETSTPLAGEWKRNISGSLTATSTAVAKARLNLLLAGETAKLEVTTRVSEIYLDSSGADGTPTRLAMKLDFTCGLRDSRSFAAVEYSDATDNDLSTMRQTRELSGSLFSDTQAHAESALGVLATAVFGSNGAQRVKKTHSLVQWAGPTVVNSIATSGGGGAQWVKLDFSLGTTVALTGVTGYDLIEASFTMERTGSLNMAVITPVPFGRPVVQTGTGYSPGRITIQASAKAISQASAKAWVQERRGLVTNIGSLGVTRHETEQPRETCEPEYAPFNGESACLWKFTGSYGWTFTGTVLDGTWGSAGLPG